MFFLKECDSFLEGISELFKVIHEGSFLSSLNGLEIHLMSLLVGPFRITFIDGQKHLKSLLLLPNIVCVWGGTCHVSAVHRKRSVRPHVRTKEGEAEAEVSLLNKPLVTTVEAAQLATDIGFTAGEMSVQLTASLSSIRMTSDL